MSPGATIAVPSPASPATDAAAAWLEGEGFSVAFAEPARRPRERAERLADAFADPDVAAIVCGVEASTSAELLRYLDLRRIAENPKPFVGCGGATVLHSALARSCGLVTFWGPLLHELGAAERATRTGLLRALQSLEPPGDVGPGAAGATTITAGIAEGELVGGAATTLCSLMGTPWEVDTRGRILLLSAPPRTPWLIGGSLLHLANAGKLQECAGICVSGLGQAAVAIEQVEALLAPLRVPAVYGLPLDGPRRPTIPLGVRARLDAYDGRLELLEAGVA